MSNNKSKIHILDRHTANQIAAGEVVERPFCVVKELVENAIDAGATIISVKIFDSSLEKIQVTDNGCGMSAEELRLSLLRHATSKISKVTDLDHLATLGFRGEALPSIASVSQMTITSKPKDAINGYSISIKDGKSTIPTEAAAKTGTTVVVDRLFYNAPARKKFLKSPRTEMGLISDLLAKYIVAYPQVAFRLENGKHTIFNSSGRGNRQNALFEAYGKNIAEQMIPFDLGFLSPPSLNRNNRAHYHFFINGRPVHSRELGLAVDEAYFSFMPAHRYPIVFLFLDLPPESVDVNVHPGKLEVKFRNFAPLREQILTAMSAGLDRSNSLAPEIMVRTPTVKPSDKEELPPTTLSGLNDITRTREKALEANESSGSGTGNLYQILYGNAKEKANTEYVAKKKVIAADAPAAPPPQVIQENLFTAGDEHTNTASKRLVYSSLTPLGQFAGTFIICSGGEYLYIIDQHAVAERILYEKIAAEAENHLGDSNQLAVPVAVELSHREALALTDAILELRDAGFIVESFGDDSFVIRSVPIWYTDDDPEQLLRLFLDEIADNPVNVVRMRKKELFMAACKQAIKANRYLSPADISVLFEQLDSCKNSSTCPHGRPLAIRISRAEIYKRFLRGSI